MIKRTLRYLAAATLGVWLAVPAPALAAVSPDPASAASAGIQYLANNQKPDGSISGFGGESEWSVEAVQAAGQQASAFAHGGSSLLDFLKTDVPGPGTAPTTLERKIIAISAAGQSPSSFGGVDYESLLSAQHLSGQIGDTTLLNDDIFGMIAIDAAHDTSLLPEAQDALGYLLAHQGTDGGFSYSADASAGSDSSDTAAAIIAMYAASDLGLGSPGVDAAQSKAQAYLLGTQQTDGGFGYDAFSPSDGSSTSWALMSLNAIGSSVSSSAASARGWLLNDQNPDGGFSYGAFGYTNSDTYTTAHAVTALLGTTWLLRPTPISIPTGTGGGTSTKQQNVPIPASTQTPQSSQPAQTSGQPAEPPTPSADLGGTDAADQVKGASTAKPSRKGTVRPATAQADKRSYSIYFLAFLGSIAIIWFVLESRKTQGDNI